MGMIIHKVKLNGEGVFDLKCEDIIKQIEDSRQDLYNLLDKSDDFNDQNIITQSQKLDKLLNVYEELKYSDRAQSL